MLSTLQQRGKRTLERVLIELQRCETVDNCLGARQGKQHALCRQAGGITAASDRQLSHPFLASDDVGSALAGF